MVSASTRMQVCVACAAVVLWTSACAPRTDVDAGSPDEGGDGGALVDAGVRGDAGADVDAGAPVDAAVLADAGAIVDAGAGLDAGPARPDAGPSPSSIDVTAYASRDFVALAIAQDNATLVCEPMRPLAAGTCVTLGDCPSCNCSSPHPFPLAPCVRGLTATNVTTGAVVTPHLDGNEVYVAATTWWTPEPWFDLERDDLRLDFDTCRGPASITIAHGSHRAPRIVDVRDGDGGTIVSLDEAVEVLTAGGGGLSATYCRDAATTSVVLPPDGGYAVPSLSALRVAPDEAWALGAVHVVRVAHWFYGVSTATGASLPTWTAPRGSISLSTGLDEQRNVDAAHTEITLDVDAGLFTFKATSLAEPPPLYSAISIVQHADVDVLTVTRAGVQYAAPIPHIELDAEVRDRAEAMSFGRTLGTVHLVRVDGPEALDMTGTLRVYVNDALRSAPVEAGAGDAGADAGGA